MSDSKSFCGVGDFPVLIPYSELCKFLEAAYKMEQMERKFQDLDRKYQGLHGQYVEIMEAVGEIRRMI